MPTIQSVYLWAAAVLLAVLVYFGWRTEERRIGARDQQIGALTASLKVTQHAKDSIAALARVANTVVGKDTAALRQVTTLRARMLGQSGALDSARAALARLARVPAAKPETLRIAVPAQLLVADDSALRVCTLTVRDCGTARGLAEAGWANERRLTTSQDSLIRTLRAVQPSILSRCGLSLGYVAGWMSGTMRYGPGVLAGCRVWP